MEKQITFDNVSLFSPITTQPFIWMAEYFSNMGLTEFDLDTKEENNFNEIDRTRINRFGLIGRGAKMYFDHFGGSFFLMGKKYSIKLRCNGEEYDLNPYGNNINDIITYKKATANLIEGVKTAQSIILGYFFGYKTKFCANNVNFTLKPIISLLADKPVFMDLSLCADKDIEGQIVFIKNNEEEFVYDISLKKGITNRSHWDII